MKTTQKSFFHKIPAVCYKILAVITFVCLLLGVATSTMACSPNQAAIKSLTNKLDREIIAENKAACDSAASKSSCEDFFNGKSSQGVNTIGAYDSYWKGYKVGDVSCYSIFKYKGNSTNIAAYTVATVHKDSVVNFIAFDYLISSNNSTLKVIKININVQKSQNPAPDPTDGQVWA